MCVCVRVCVCARVRARACIYKINENCFSDFGKIMIGMMCGRLTFSD